MHKLHLPYWGFILLLATALIGLSVLQYLWMQEAIQQKELDLKYSVNAALEEAGAEWRMRYTYDFISISENADSQQMALKNMEQIIEDIFTERTLPLEYDFGIYNQHQAKFLSLKDSTTQSEKIMNSIYSACLSCMVTIHFSDNDKSDGIAQNRGFILQHDEDHLERRTGYKKNGIWYLGMYFPEKTTIIRQKVSRMFMLSLLFSTLLLIVFLYVLHNWQRQKKLNDFKEDFINNLTHEFKTPLASILLATKTLQLSPKKEMMQNLLALITNEGKRIENRIENILQLAIIESGELNLDKHSLNLHQLLKETVNRFQIFIDQRNAVVNLNLQASQSEFLADKTHIGNVFYNLIDNALKYTPNNTQIEICTYETNKHLCVQIADNGIGISEDRQQQIFKKFYRVPKVKAAGFGLGLSYVQQIIEAHQAKLEVESKEGKGTSFTILFERTS
ncbi:MAG: HAMP domain-containing sensor histidine kinase [Bacteroidota bacterium]